MLGLAVVFAIVAAFLAQSWLRSQVGPPVEQTVIVQEAPKAPETTIVVARQPLFYGNELTRQNVREIPWLANDLPAGTFQKIEDLFTDDESRIVLRTMEQNEPVLASKISGDDRAATMSAIIPIGMRAITMGSNVLTGVGGYIIPGDRVDMMLTREGGSKLETTVLLQNVQILGIDQQISEDQQEPRVVRSLTIAVTPAQAPKIVLAYSVGKLTLSLRNRGDADPTRATRVTVADLGIGEAFRPEGAGTTGSRNVARAVTVTPRKRGASVAVARGLKVFKYTVQREKFEPLTPTQLAPSASDGASDSGASAPAAAAATPPTDASDGAA
ncbi:MAG: Flp pilus assembly protein CpaB, partial [Alphaproteobacteria bacterium]|nr:Flp pilus assembly protein CpaB [Alphaproteobacteria bacterium]